MIVPRRCQPEEKDACPDGHSCQRAANKEWVCCTRPIECPLGMTELRDYARGEPRTCSSGVPGNCPPGTVHRVTVTQLQNTPAQNRRITVCIFAVVPISCVSNPTQPSPISHRRPVRRASQPTAPRARSVFPDHRLIRTPNHYRPTSRHISVVLTNESLNVLLDLCQ